MGATGGLSASAASGAGGQAARGTRASRGAQAARSTQLGEASTRMKLLEADRSRLARAQPAQMDRADRHPAKLQHLVAQLREHPPDLPILSLGENNLKKGAFAALADAPDTFRPHAAFADPHALSQLLQIF